MRFTKPIAEQNISIPTWQAYLESHRVSNFTVGTGSIQVPYNANHSIVIKDFNGSYIVLPMANFAIQGKRTEINSIGGGDDQLWISRNSGNVTVSGYDQYNGNEQLNGIITELYTVQF